MRETAEGRRELEAANDAMLLMDGQKESASREQGARNFNGGKLREVARALGKPIASIRALHNQPKDVKADEVDADDFDGGLQNRLELCEGARVLLTTICGWRLVS